MIWALLALLGIAAARRVSDAPPPTGTPAEFVAWIAPHAQAMQRRLGIPASAAIAQALLESDGQLGAGYAPSWLAVHARNLFGMTAAGTGAGNPFWHGVKVFRGDRWWRVYATYNDSVMDYGHLFYRVSAYRRGLDHLDDAAAFLAAIVPTYAPASDGNAGYLSAVLSLIERHGLRAYDVPRSQWALDPQLVGVRYA